MSTTHGSFILYCFVNGSAFLSIMEFLVREFLEYSGFDGVIIVGMDGVDKEKVQRVVYEMSKGSKYFENEEKKEAYMKQKIDSMRAQCAKLASGDVTHFQKVYGQRQKNPFVFLSFMYDNCPFVSFV